jgi:hypothetical protein
MKFGLRMHTIHEVEIAEKNLAQKKSNYYSAAQKEWSALDYISFLD